MSSPSSSPSYHLVVLEGFPSLNVSRQIQQQSSSSSSSWEGGEGKRELEAKDSRKRG